MVGVMRMEIPGTHFQYQDKNNTECPMSNNQMKQNEQNEQKIETNSK
jgi:hypothetical protein